MTGTLECPSCPLIVEVSDEDPDASLSDMRRHLFSAHADYDNARTNQLLALVNLRKP